MEDDEHRLASLWQHYSARLLAYALRHTDRAMAEEVVSETFLVAWRRIREVPGDPLPWLLVVARNTLANQRRSQYRRRILADELRRLETLAGPGAAADSSVLERAAVLQALAQLSEKEREAVLLIAWDGLTPAAAATVAGCSQPAFHVRLHRARRKLNGLEPQRRTAEISYVPRGESV